MKVAQKEEKRAFFKTWGDSNSKSDESEPDCLMADEVDSDSEDEDDIKVTYLKLELIEHTDLIALTKCLIEENSTYSVHLEDLELETKQLKIEIHFLKRSLDDAQQFAKLPKSSTNSCAICRGKTKVDDISLNVNPFEQIMTKLDSISASIEAKAVPQTVL